MIKANLTGEVPHVIKSVTNVIGFLGETKGGDPIPLRQSEVNRMLGKVDEFWLQDESDILFLSFMVRMLKLLTDHLTDLMEQLKK